MNEFKKIYFESILQLNKNILEIKSDVNGKKYSYSFNMNKIYDFPEIYRNVSVFLSAKNTDIFHFVKRHADKTRNASEITLIDIKKIIHQAINFYLNNKNKFNFNQSFLIISKKFPNIKIPIQMTKNNIYTIDKMELSEKFENLFFSDYFCFVYTILSADMISTNIFDKEIICETIYL